MASADVELLRRCFLNDFNDFWLWSFAIFGTKDKYSKLIINHPPAKAVPPTIRGTSLLKGREIRPISTHGVTSSHTVSFSHRHAKTFLAQISPPCLSYLRQRRSGSAFGADEVVPVFKWIKKVSPVAELVEATGSNHPNRDTSAGSVQVYLIVIPTHGVTSSHTVSFPTCQRR